MLFLLALSVDLVLELMPGVDMGANQKLCAAAVIALLWTVSCLPLRSPAAKRCWLFGLFCYYLWLLLNVLFFDAAFGRGAGMHPRYTPAELYRLLRAGGAAEGVSMVPLRTIRNYLSAYEYGNISRELMLLNLGGNLAAFAPMGFFLPALYRPQRWLPVYLLTMGAAIAAVEVLQAYTGCGAADLDDWILNMAGAAVLWLILLPLTGYLRRSQERRKEK